MRLQLAFLAALAILARAKVAEKRQTTGPVCVRQDIVYMLDSSSYIGLENFLQQLEFVKSNIKYYNINPSCTRVGIVTYSSGAYKQFYLNGYTTQQQLIQAIGNIQYQPGGTNTGDVINYVSSSSFTAAHGGRTGVPHYGILVTGSSSASPALSVSAAQAAQQNGMTLFTVGVGNGINRAELSSIASSGRNQFYAQNYNALGSVAAPLATRINGVVTSSTSGSLGTPATCLQQADVVFMVDGSGSIGSANFLKLENFVKSLTGQLDVGANKVHIGLMQFSNYPSQEFPLNMYSSRQDVMSGVDNMKYMGGGTNTADALKYMREHMFSQTYGARPNVPRVGIVITDGKSSNTVKTTSEAAANRNDHIGMISIGVGSGVDATELNSIAGSSSSVFQVSNYDQLNNIAAQIVSRSCSVQVTAPPATMSPASGSGTGGSLATDPCKDVNPDCASYDKSACSSYFGWAKDNCARYCGFCLPTFTTAPPPCIDALSNCNEYEANSCVGKFESWAKTNCRKYCGYCDSTSQNVGFYGQCYYKGNAYKQGQKWDDGCDYQCMCEDGATGRYQCYNKCPVYYNLPAQCTLVKSETECCLQPVCDFNPKISTFETTQHGNTPDGIDVCVYKNHQYYQGQTWEDACQYTCTCTNGKTGLYKCQTMCPDYNTLPSYCHLVTKTGQCCAKPVCEFTTQQGSFSGSGTISGHGISVSPTAPPQCLDALPDCSRYGKSACENFKPWARDNCIKTCNLCVVNTVNPAPTDVCIHSGKAFHQGESWKIGCDTTCTCENAAYGYYRCVNSCPTYNNLPSTCHMTKKAGDCCTSVQCEPGTGTFISSTGNLATIGNGGLITVTGGGAIPTLPSGGTPAPGTGGTSGVAPSLKGCLYKGQVYIQGQTWEDGCQFSCQCTDGNQGLYSCRQKCPTFPNLPSECHLDIDPSDPCCQRPKCSFTGTPTPVFPVYKPGTTGHNAVQPPNPGELYQGTQTVVFQFTGAGNNPNPPTANPNITGGIGYCEYKGHTYQQAETWEDGCLYNCVCEDASIGFYRCRDKCPKYPPLPKQCQLIQDPANICCQKPNCSFVGVVTSINGHGVITTPSPQFTTQKPIIYTQPKPKMCVYKNKEYGQGQMWFDGCEYKCSCDDATVGFYRCLKRCPVFFNVPSSCKMVADPNDPGCCQVPQCIPTPAPGQTLPPGVIPTIAPGVFNGKPNTTQTNIGYCEYKGRHYNQGQTWMDGCDYSCTCRDASTGAYQCVDRCPSYGALPSQCRMIADFTNPCCTKPDCSFSPTFGEHTGTLAPPTPGPGLTYAPNVHPTQAPTLKYCVYKNAQYSQGQSWNDGCQYRCRCDDASRGLYVCDDRCPQYQNIPAQCTMETDPSDACCRQPKCDFTPTIGGISGTLAPSIIPTKVPGHIIGQAQTPAPTPGPDGHYPTPLPLNYCQYKGSQYMQGATWDDGCDYTCRCVDAAIGKYQCDEKCPKYSDLPVQCRLIKDAAKPCCFKPVCDFTPTSGGITGQGTTLAPQPGHTVAPQPGTHTVGPNPNPYPTPGLPKAVCNYKTSQYTQGQQWFDGCNFKCTCEQAEKGIYRCSRRCADYPSIPAGCTLVADPSDPLCCKVPECTPVSNTSNPFPTPPPGHITGGTVTQAPTPFNTPAPQPGVSTQRPPINPTPAPVPKAVCVYKGRQYTQGQRWQDGCDYNCVCKDAMSGLYDCTEICAKYPNLPAQCKMVRDYNKPCCQVPQCNFTPTTGEHTGQLTPAPQPGVSTVAPIPGVHPTAGPTLAPTPKKLCNYNGVLFKQGQRWDDGCDLQCVCENEMTGYYRCNQRCAQYTQVPAGCTLETDPTDPCCRVPSCKNLPTPAPLPTSAPVPHGQNPTLSPTMYPGQPTPAPSHTLAPGINPTPHTQPQFPTLAPPVINGQGVTPTPKPGVPTGAPTVPVCVYNGKSYTQGQTWQDGCQYNCECVDAMSGQYRCTERCPVYPNIPSYCRMVTSQSDACCKVPECITLPTPQPNPYNTPAPQPGVSTLRPPVIVNTPAPGHPTAVPQPGHATPAPVTQKPTPIPRQVCIMSGKQYTQGQRWNDGCDRICVCDDGMTGHYTCDDRCKRYNTIPQGCTMVPDPADPICCQVPQCIQVPGTNGVPTPGPTDKPQIYTNAPHAVVTGTGTPPTPAPVTTVAPQPGVSTLAPQPVTAAPATTPKPKVCVYKGVTYLQDQRWQDGCDYDCICNDGMTGRYTCTARCGSYPNLPRQCHLTRDPKDYCCYVPECDWNKPTPNPYVTPKPQITAAPQPGISTVAPQPGVHTVAPNPNPTYAPKAFCVMNGITFQQGQSLRDGCSQICRCDDADTNYYNCYDRCPNYPNVPAGCIMVTDPNDACCQIPECNVIPTPAPSVTQAPVPHPGVNPTLAPGVNPTPAPGVNPTPAPGVNPTPAPGVNPTPAPGVNPTPAPSPIPTAVPGIISNKPDPTRPTTQRGFCVYNGIKYTTGQTWHDGCTYNCICLDDMTGQYKCTERCPRYPSIPTYCVMVEDPNDRCCKTPSCPGLTPTLAPNQTPAPIPNFTPAPGTPGPHINPTPAPGHPTPATGTQAPNPHGQPTPAPVATPQPSPIPKNVCIMSGKAYTQGQRWYDGCKQICVCDDGVTGHYTCNQRCATYNNIAPTCVFVPDPSDPACCQIPKCITPGSVTPKPVVGIHTGGGPQPTPRPNYTPAPIPGQFTPAPGVNPTLAPQPGHPTPAPIPGVNTPAPTPGPKVCVYKGSMYTQGQTWRDGCQYDCTCDDAEHGKYTCTDICPSYPGLPVYCTYVYDPLNPCCKKPECSTPAPQPQITPAPVPGVSTQAPVPNPNPTPTVSFCVYKGMPLKPGQTFNDGCDKVCRCEDSMTNSVVCDERCPTYPALRPGCSMVTDPRDSCCQVPECQPVNPSNSPNTTVLTGIPGTITGHNQPSPNPVTGLITGSRDVCLYHGVPYKTGAKWDDGCTYNCICIDGMSGSYRCTERCARYPKVPSQCTLVQDPTDICCQKPQCQFIAPTPIPNQTPAPIPGVVQTPAPQPGVNTPAPQPGVNTPAPQPGVSTPAPQPGVNTPAPRMVCQYKNQLYKQDQVWYDACNAICRCENAATGYYRCQERCAKYPSVPAACTLVPDPKDPACCKVASCPVKPSGATPTPGYLTPNPNNTPAPAIVTGVAPVPTVPATPRPNPTPAPVPGVSTSAPNPNPTPAPQPTRGCLYNGVIYSKGQKWDDGCDYHCVCIDDMTGQYSCTKRCADYPQVPPQCVLVQDPKDQCCKVPYCDYVNPSPFPHGIPTPAPNPFQTPVPGQTTLAPGLTPAPVPQGYCVYKGVYYTQGQTWDDGCDKKCRCDDVMKGYYSCTNRCPSYNQLPGNCKLVTDPTDNCCLVPDCNTFTAAPQPGTGSSGHNTPIIFNPVTNPDITGSHQVTTPRPIYVVPSSLPGTFTGTSNNNPSGSLGTGPSGRTNACVYKGSAYKQNMSWDDGCQYRCTCVDETRGQYRCTERCPHYVNLPSFCTYKQDPNDRCCQVASCDVSKVPTPAPQTHYTPSPPLLTNQPITVNPGYYTGPAGSNNPITLNPGVNPGVTGSHAPFTNYPGVSVNPGYNTGPSGSGQPIVPTSITGVRDKCVYQDMSQHAQGTTWQDGCDKTCVCMDPTTNSYRCTERCQVYSDIPSSCFLTQDPNDACCKVPKCSGSLTPLTATGTGGTGPSGSNVVPIGTHTSFSGTGRPDNIPGMSTTGSRSVCVYKGTVHKQGDSWDDGCQFTCTCTDGSKGLYSCTSKCPSYPTNIPSYCTMNTIPGMCCKSLSCNIPTLGNYNPAPQLVPTPAPSLAPGQTPTPSTGGNVQMIYPSGTQPVIGGGNPYPGGGFAIPPGVSTGSFRNQCIYKNRLYNQGEKWDDGCDYSCECKDSKTGYYQCQPLCAQYKLSQGCYTVKATGQCCDQPVCTKPDGSQFNPITNPSPQYPIYGTYPGGMGGFRPGYNPSTGATATSGTNVVTGQSHRCIYNGRIYNQDQRWDDGCDYTCTCTDAQNGMYTCSPMCPQYTALPSSCHMVTLPGQCCQEPRCTIPVVATIATPHVHVTPAPHLTGCYDAITNCKAYGRTSCVAPYETWAKQNCMAYCGFCNSSNSQTSFGCVDTLTNCDQFGASACTGKYEPWARDNCMKTCNLCTTTSSSIITHVPATSSSGCVDKLQNCADYGQSACVAPYEQWAIDNCMKTCNKCSAVFNPGTTMGGSLPTNNWVIMMKGVAGVPGDLFTLWNSPNTANQNVPEAMYLTNQYPGHYKPDLSNYWSSLCIDKVKVAIFNKGVEKANIIFDASGSDKNSWFDQSRIISSTWTDIKYAPKNLFSLLGDQSTGREFYISNSGSGCNAQGWIMVSTKNNCPFEQGSAKPAFYYAPGQSSANWASTTPGSGDVFAILAHPSCQGVGPTQPSVTITATSAFCIYKSKVYTQGENWQDGCEYNCTCEDAVTGFYRCTNLCPVWNNLPQGCNLQKPTGECCSKPVCPGGITIGSNNLTDTCFYGNKYYHQNEQWQDGCNYKCECKDGKTGFYECNTLCLQWNLPKVCHMDPAPTGKCCPIPNCPSYVNIQYPAGYVQY